MLQKQESEQCCHNEKRTGNFSRRLTAAERNYNVGNRELLVVKLPLEEWRHWLEGAEHPFLIWTDHKNLAYIQDAKRLNSQQVRWQLFFNKFQFSLTYRQGSCNQKPDALSRQHAIEEVLEAPEGIIPRERIIAVDSWDIESQIQEALKEDLDPGTGPQHRRYVPGSVCPQVMQWGHSSRLACHPGGGRTLGLLRCSFWWPTIERDVRKFVAGCAICARGKAPTCPWSHIALDFVTGLPESQGYTTILTIVDRFPKAVHFVPLTKLPSAMETAELLVEHVLRLHGILAEITSDRGPQFISGLGLVFWQLDCRLLRRRWDTTHPC